MKSRHMIWLVTFGMAAGAAWHGNLAAVYTAFIGGAIFAILHAIEFKLNRLLDHHSIRVSDRDLSED